MEIRTEQLTIIHAAICAELAKYKRKEGWGHLQAVSTRFWGQGCTGPLEVSSIEGAEIKRTLRDYAKDLDRMSKKQERRNGSPALTFLADAKTARQIAASF